MQQFLLTTYTLALTSFLPYIVWLLKRENKKRDANERGTMLLLRVQLIEYHDKYCYLKEVPSYVYENFIEMYDCYTTMDENGMIKKMYEEFKELELQRKKKLETIDK